MFRYLLKIGPITIYSYGVMLALAFFAGTWLAVLRAQRQGMDRNKILDLVFYILISSLVGARALFVVLEWQYYRQDILAIFKIWEGGLVFYGGFILAFLVAVWFLNKEGLSFFSLADILAPGLALGIAIGRLGCFLNGCCYGKISSAWGISFPAKDEPAAFAQQVWEGWIAPGAKCSLPVLPTQLYESLAALGIFFLLLWLERRRRFTGFSFWVLVLWYSFFRFIIEYFRYYQGNFFFAGFTISQLISLGLFAISALALINGLRKD